MGGQESKEKVSTTSACTVAITTASPDTIRPRRRIVQNFLLIWVDANIDESSEDCQNTLTELRSVVNDVNIFTQPDQCVQFLNELQDEKAFAIISGSLSEHLIPNIHDQARLDAIYIFSENKLPHENWTKEWVKIKGIYTDVESICEALQHAVKQCNQDSVAMSFVTVSEGASSENLDQLESSFMYTQIFKEILLEMEHHENSIKDLANYCRQFYKDNIYELIVIDDFEHNYRSKSPIWWYTRERFTYQMLNRALRTLESDTIIKMGFFIHDLHKQIHQLYEKQVGTYCGKPFTVYRGQGLLKVDFEKLVQTKDGLMFFNNFLSTSTKWELSRYFAKQALTSSDTIGVVFEMSIDPSVSSAPFASIREVSYFPVQEEILFSMHTVFRIGEINKIDNNDLLYKVDLKLTADDDQQLRTLTERIREEVAGETGWQRLGGLLIKIGQFDKAEELYKVLIEQASDEGDKTLYYHQLAYIKDCQGDYQKAIEYYEKALVIFEKTLPPNHPDLAQAYNHIASMYDNRGNYSKALSSYKKALEIYQKTLPPDHPDLAISYSNIGSVYNNMGEYSKALSSHEKALEIRQKTLPPNHPSCATSYNNIGSVYDNMREHLRALSSYEKALAILEKTLPPNPLDLATSYGNIGLVYMMMGEYSKALSFYDKALEIFEKSLPPNHPSLATLYNNIGLVYDHLGEYSKALSCHEKALEIKQKTLPPNHSDFAQSYNNIASVYDKRGEYEKALSFNQKALEIGQKTRPPNNTSLATSYGNIGLVYNNMGEYSKALSFNEKALKIKEKTLPPNHPDFAQSYNNIASVYNNMGEYSKALSLNQKALEIQETTLHENHPDLANSYNYIGLVYKNMGEYSKALSYFERALDIWQHALIPNHPDAQTTRESIEIVKKNL